MYFHSVHFIEKKKERRPVEREKRREKFRLERQAGGLSKEQLRAAQLERLQQAAATGIKVAIDLQFDDAMNEKVGGGIMSIGL
jgi:hypothetical protein